MTPEAFAVLKRVADVITDSDETHCTPVIVATLVLKALRDLPIEITERIGTRMQCHTMTAPAVAHDARVYWREIIDEILRN